MKILVIAEHAEAATALAAGARSLGADEVEVATVGAETPADGIAEKAYHVAVPEGAVADDAWKTLAPVAEGADAVLAEPTRHVKSIVGRLAAEAGASTITDVASFADGAAESMYFGGVGTIERKATGKAFYTAGPAAFGDAEATGANAGAEELAWAAPENAVRLVSSKPVEKSGVDLTKSDVVVAAGRGFAAEDDLQLARDLAEKTGAGLGCSRPLAEGEGWLPTETYIGVSGLVVAPKVYIAAGISGQMQHMVGCNGSGTIFAINKDANAPIFKQCDYGLVGDVKDVLPKITEAL